MESKDWRQEFVELILQNKIEQAYSRKRMNIPKRVYKYRNVSPYSLQNFRDNTIWISNPANMNDPFDSGLHFLPDLMRNNLLKNDLEAFTNSLNLNSHFNPDELTQIKASDQPFDETIKILKEKFPKDVAKLEILIPILKEFQEKYDRKLLSDFNSNLKSSLKLCSFSAKNDSILMWSHYANCHTGFCMEYDFQTVSESTHKINRMLFPVIYSENLFDATKILIEKDSIPLVALLASLYKSPEWSYEEEWRLTFPFGVIEQDTNFAVPKPTGVYVGAKINDNDFNEIRQIALINGIPLYRMELSVNSFKLRPILVE